ncbi:MAG: M28 family metallopeptidase [Candidatus Helarchaeota archaeon]
MNYKILIIIIIISNTFAIQNTPISFSDQSKIIELINNNININILKEITTKLCENKSRITGTINCNYSALYIRDRLEALNVSDVYFERFCIDNKTALNIVGWLRSNSSTSKNILIMAHYDSISVDNIAPGANDNAASIACILEIVRILQLLLNLNKSFTTYNLICLFTAGEEQALYGSRAWILQNHDLLNKICLVINFDMIGWGDHHTIIGADSCQWVANYIIKMSGIISVKICKSHANYPSTGRSDHINFMNARIPTIWIFESNKYYPYMHTAQDTIDKVNFTMVKNCARLFSFVLYNLLIISNNDSSHGIFYLSIGLIAPICSVIFFYVFKVNRKISSKNKKEHMK